LIRPRLVFRVFSPAPRALPSVGTADQDAPHYFTRDHSDPAGVYPELGHHPKIHGFVSAIVEPNGHLVNYRHGARRDCSESWKSNHSKREEIMSTFYKKATLICAAAAAGTVLCAMPISVERSAISGIVLSIDQAQARVGHPGSAVSVAGVNRRHRRADRRCATGVTC